MPDEPTKPTKAEQLKEGQRILDRALEGFQAFEDDMVGKQLKDAEDERSAAENRIRVGLSHILLDEKLYRRFGGQKIIDLTKTKQLERAATKAEQLVDTQTTRLERSLLPKAGRITKG